MHWEAWQDSYTSPCLLPAQTVTCLERSRLYQGDEKQPQIISDRSFIIFPACLSVTRTMILIFLFCVCVVLFFFLERTAAAADSSFQLQVEYFHWTLPDMLFAPQANKSHCVPWQILIDTFKAIIWNFTGTCNVFWASQKHYMKSSRW